MSCKCEYACDWFVRIEGLRLSWNCVDMLVECGWRVERLARIVGGKRQLDAASVSFVVKKRKVGGLFAFFVYVESINCLDVLESSIN